MSDDRIDLVSHLHSLTGLLSFMLSDEMTTGSVTTSDAEKGLIDAHSMRQTDATVVISPRLSRQLDDEKKLDEKRQEFVPSLPFIKEKEVVPIPKPVAKPKKKASKWTLWRLWFNTYR